jgi:hypothetical protein
MFVSWTAVLRIALLLVGVGIVFLDPNSVGHVGSNGHLAVGLVQPDKLGLTNS